MVILEQVLLEEMLSPCITITTRLTARASQACKVVGEPRCSQELVAVQAAGSDISNSLLERLEETISMVSTVSCQKVTMRIRTAMTLSQKITESRST